MTCFAMKSRTRTITKTSALEAINRFGGRRTVGIFDGSNKDGLDYVPYDGYISELHKGERVLTANENLGYSSGVTAPSLSPITYNNRAGATVTVEYAPVIHINGNAPDDLEDILNRQAEELVVIVDERLRERAENERRMAYD